jgi:NAD(P)-dependent dehydrogenase (short-subunit alcohol dehydrogenase family)
MEISLKNKVVLVTGSARRVGKAIALEFARQGANLVIHHGSSPDEAEETCKEIRALGVEAFPIQADQGSPTALEHLFAEIQRHYGRLDVLVNSAASFMKKPLLEVSVEEWQNVLDVNLTGPWLCTQHAARLMINGGTGGAIVNLSDMGGLYPWKSRPHHSISKAGVIMLTKVSALALAEHNIRVNCVVPGAILPPAGESPEVWERVIARIPLKRSGEPDDVGRACVFLATNDFINGTILTLDGGESVAKKP